VVVINSIPNPLFSGDKKQAGSRNQRHILVGRNGHFVEYDKEDFSLNEYMGSVEEDILKVMAGTYGNTYKIAEILKINQSSVVRKLQKYGIRIQGKRSSASEYEQP
jgi:transcriptional regulator with PAS, ATPase and Fis domain